MGLIRLPLGPEALVTKKRASLVLEVGSCLCEARRRRGWAVGKKVAVSPYLLALNVVH